MIIIAIIIIIIIIIMMMMRMMISIIIIIIIIMKAVILKCILAVEDEASATSFDIACRALSQTEVLQEKTTTMNIQYVQLTYFTK